MARLLRIQALIRIGPKEIAPTQRTVSSNVVRNSINKKIKIIEHEKKKTNLNSSKAVFLVGCTRTAQNHRSLWEAVKVISQYPF